MLERPRPAASCVAGLSLRDVDPADRVDRDPIEQRPHALDGLEGVYRQAREERKAAETALSAWAPAAKTGGRSPKFDHRLLTGYY